MFRSTVILLLVALSLGGAEREAEISSKLDVKNRDQMVLRSRELNIL